MFTIYRHATQLDVPFFLLSKRLNINLLTVCTSLERTFYENNHDREQYIGKPKAAQ